MDVLFKNYGINQIISRNLFKGYKHQIAKERIISVVSDCINIYLETNKKYNCPFCCKPFHKRTLFQYQKIKLKCHEKYEYDNYNIIIKNYLNDITKDVEKFIFKELKDPYYEKYRI
jgi:ribosomal protein L37AE/L43A